MGQREWRVITAGGHSPEHASFYCETRFDRGDQILSHITPSVIATSAQPDANPMKEYLIASALESLPADTLVLPSHGLPFRALHTRLAQLREHHQVRLDAIASVVTSNTSAFATAQELFPRVLYDNPRQTFGGRLPIPTCLPRWRADAR